MFLRSLFVFSFLSLYCFGSVAFLDKDRHIPPSSDSGISFCTTRALDDGSLKIPLLSQLKAAFQIETFVETGTYLGDTTIKAASIFDEVHTIELDQKLFLSASNRLARWNNIQVHLGDSGEIFKKLLPSIDRRILFYLDGHYSGHVTARGSLDTPLLIELEAIKNAKKDDSIILIDDIRLFQDSCFPEKIKSLNYGLETYPDLEKVVKAILNINPDYQICFLGDALLAFPSYLGVGISPVMRSCALHRLEHLCMNLSEEELRAADDIIIETAFEEKEEMRIYYQTYSSFECDYGYRCYACFWYALILLKNGQKEAQALLKKAADNSLPGWSISRWVN